jgi:hypothetical protein
MCIMVFWFDGLRNYVLILNCSGFRTYYSERKPLLYFLLQLYKAEYIVIPSGAQLVFVCLQDK